MTAARRRTPGSAGVTSRERGSPRASRLCRSRSGAADAAQALGGRRVLPGAGDAPATPPAGSQRHPCPGRSSAQANPRPPLLARIPTSPGRPSAPTRTRCPNRRAKANSSGFASSCARRCSTAATPMACSPRDARRWCAPAMSGGLRKSPSPRAKGLLREARKHSRSILVEAFVSGQATDKVMTEAEALRDAVAELKNGFPEHDRRVARPGRRGLGLAQARIPPPRRARLPRLRGTAELPSRRQRDRPVADARRGPPSLDRMRPGTGRQADAGYSCNEGSVAD